MVQGTKLSFTTETMWSAFMAHSSFGFGDGVSTAEVSTDGGLSWSVAWTDDVVGDLDPKTIVVDLSAYDGMSNVQVAFGYVGTDAHTWWIDDVIVDDGPADTYTITSLVGSGTATFTVTQATPSGQVLIGYSLTGAGPTSTQFGSVDMSMPISALPPLIADAAGVATLVTVIPPQASGRTLYSQAVDLTTGTLCNSLAQPFPVGTQGGA